MKEFLEPRRDLKVRAGKKDKLFAANEVVAELGSDNS